MLLAAGALVLGACHKADPPPKLGLFTSLPILWSEADGLRAEIDGPPRPHWARAVLGEGRRLVPLDTLLHPGDLADLVIAQPRPLEPAENVALDGWVRQGGHVLLFADPLLTATSRFALGDPRRPVDSVVLDPLFAHWGLALHLGDGLRESAGLAFRVRAPGRLESLPGGPRDCRIEQDGLIAACRIGRGFALIFADAALLEAADDTQPGGRDGALRALMRRAFAR